MKKEEEDEELMDYENECLNVELHVDSELHSFAVDYCIRIQKFEVKELRRRRRRGREGSEI